MGVGVGKSRGCLKIKIKVAYISICDLQFNDDGKKKLCKTGQKETLLLAKKTTHGIWHSNRLQTHLIEQLR